MKNIFVNGIAAKSAGGKSILTNFLSLAKADHCNDFKFFVIVPHDSDFTSFESEKIKIIPAFRLFSRNVGLIAFYYLFLKNFLNRKSIDIILNFSDIVIPTKKRQYFLFDWPYAIYPESSVWNKMSLKECLIRKVKLIHFKHYSKKVTRVFAQTATSKLRLERIFGIESILIVPNAVSMDHFNSSAEINYNFPKDKIKLLYLSKYYIHKNIEIFIPIAKLIKVRKLNFVIITTIEKSQHKNAEKYLLGIKENELENILINVGNVQMKNVPSLYRQVDGLLMPTLLESFSGTYVEAMFHQKTIITSDFDFAKDVCGDVAYYFNPSDPLDIVNKLEMAFGDKKTQENKINMGVERLNNMATWPIVYEKIRNELLMLS